MAAMSDAMFWRTSTTKDLNGHVIPEDMTAATDAIAHGIAWGGQ